MNIAKLFAESMQRMQKMREELSEARLEGTAGGGAVKAVVSGLGDLVDLQIAPEVVDPNDAAMLQDLVLAAVKEGLANARSLQQEKAKEMTGGIPIPGLFQ
jgi:DNA-binding YbaB/EbfC family protein